jgi:hypothetical protein
MGLQDLKTFGDSPQGGKRRGAGRVIQVYSVTHKWNISFFAALTSYNDSYNINYAKEEVFGRMDPICTYKNTQRSISFALEAMAQGFGDGMHLQQKLSYLAANLYPTYDKYGTLGETSATSLLSPPYFRLSFGQMMTDGSKGFGAKEGSDNIVGYGPYGEFPGSDDADITNINMDVSTNGLTGIIESFSFQPKLELGMWNTTDEAKSGLIVVPKGYDISFDFTVLNSVTPGWEKDGDSDKPINESFPGGFSITDWEREAGKRFHPADPYKIPASEDTGGEGGTAAASSDVVTPPVASANQNTMFGIS